MARDKAWKGDNYRIVNKRLRLAFALLLVTVLAVAGWFTFHSHEPEFEGEPLQVWLAKLYAGNDGQFPDPDAEATLAVRSIGTNAIPRLLEYLSASDPPVKREFARWVEKQDVIDFKFRWAEEDHGYAVAGFRALGELGTPAIPTLVTLMNDTNAGGAAVECLGMIGPSSARELRAGLTHTNADIRRACVWNLGVLGTNASLVVPALIARLQDSDSTVAMLAAMTLGQLRLAPSQVVPALTNMLNRSDWRVSRTAVAALGQFGSNALPALPALMQAFENNPGTYFAAFARAIENISPGKSIPQLIELSRHSDPRTAGRAIAILGLAGGRALPAVSTLLARADREADTGLASAASAAAQKILAQWRTNASPELVECSAGGVIRGSRLERRMALVFVGHAYAEGGETILKELRRNVARGSFFLTGDFLANTNSLPLIRRFTSDGDYVGPHAAAPLPDRSLPGDLATRMDLVANLEKLEAMGLARSRMRYFLPAFEHFGPQVAAQFLGDGVTLINYTPGTMSNADATSEADTNFVSSQAIFDSIVNREREDPQGLNGFILLLHLGSGPGRADKFHPHFGELLDYLSAKGYQFVRVDELLEPKAENGKGKMDQKK